MSQRHPAETHDHAHGHDHAHDHKRVHAASRQSPATLLRIGLGARLALAGGLIVVIWLLILPVLS